MTGPPTQPGGASRAVLGAVVAAALLAPTTALATTATPPPLVLTAAAATAGRAPMSVPAPPEPPAVRVGAPAGATPGAAAGLRSPRECVPYPAGSTEPTDTAPARRLQLAAAHRIATGAGRLIAVIDTGVAPHPRLGARLRGGGDYLTGGDGLDDCDGHGTAVAGVLAASASDDDEVVGIAPGAELLSIRQSSPSYEVPGPDGRARPAGDIATLAESVVLAVREGADVINISEAVCLPPEQAADEGGSLHAALRHAADADVVVVAAAGNAGVGLCADAGTASGQVSLPGWYDELVAVGATGPDDAAAAFTVPGRWVDLAAPGTGMRSLAVGGGLTAEPVAGTSFSAPWVAGLAALVRERFPQLRAEQVVDRIVATARRPAGGRDDSLGHGVIDPVAALTAEPAVLRVDQDVPGAAPTAVLAGTTPHPAPPATPPVDAIGLVVLLGAAAVAATFLRGRVRAPGK